MSEVQETPVEVEVTTPAAEPTETPAPIEAEAADMTTEVEAPVAEPEVTDDGRSRFSSLMDTLGEIPDEPNATLLESIDEKSIEQLPDSVKGMFKHLISAQRAEQAKANAALQERETKLEERYKELAEQNKVLIRNRAQLNQVLMDPKFQDMIKAAETPEEELPDPMSQEGIEARIRKGVAQAMKQFQEPITAAAHRAQQLSAYQDFVDSHPKMNEAAFKSDVRTLMQERKDSGSPIALPDAYALVERNRLIADQEKQTAKERLRRNESNRQVQRATMSSSPSSGDPVPKWVTEKGYNGARGNSARIMYLRDNPKALQALRAKQKSR